MCNFVRQKAQVLLHPNVDEGRADQYRRVHSDGAICHGGKLAGERGDTIGKGFKQATIKKCVLFQPTTNESLIPAQMDISTAKSPSTIFDVFSLPGGEVYDSEGNSSPFGSTVEVFLLFALLIRRHKTSRSKYCMLYGITMCMKERASLAQ